MLATQYWVVLLKSYIRRICKTKSDAVNFARNGMVSAEEWLQYRSFGYLSAVLECARCDSAAAHRLLSGPRLDAVGGNVAEHQVGFQDCRSAAAFLLRCCQLYAKLPM